ncbi:MAG: hydrogenase maturation protease [Chloroflexia bacterium]|jgi:hydrogenase maturation protease|nr:hydrogenase maturation protease [Chloroflexia bacterium]
MQHTLILGLGNPMMSDDGLGSSACQQLQRWYGTLPDVTVFDGETLGLHLLPQLVGVTNLLMVDAVVTDDPPGSLVRLEGEAITAGMARQLSLHYVGLAELLALGSLEGAMPSRCVLWGMVPERLELGTELSATVAACLPALLAAVAAELQGWGIARQDRDA